MASRAEQVERTAITEEDGNLAFADDHLRAEAKIAGTVFRLAVDDLGAGLVKELNDIDNARHGSLLMRVA
jgi:hypothetical protein